MAAIKKILSISLLFTILLLGVGTVKADGEHDDYTIVEGDDNINVIISLADIQNVTANVTIGDVSITYIYSNYSTLHVFELEETEESGDLEMELTYTLLSDPSTILNWSISETIYINNTVVVTQTNNQTATQVNEQHTYVMTQDKSGGLTAELFEQTWFQILCYLGVIAIILVVIRTQVKDYNLYVKPMKVKRSDWWLEITNPYYPAYNGRDVRVALFNIDTQTLLLVKFSAKGKFQWKGRIGKSKVYEAFVVSDFDMKTVRRFFKKEEAYQDGIPKTKQIVRKARSDQRWRRFFSRDWFIFLFLILLSRIKIN